MQDLDGQGYHYGGKREHVGNCSVFGWREDIAEVLLEWAVDRFLIKLQHVLRSDDHKGFKFLPRRWVMEHTFAWLNHTRRLSKDYEVSPETADLHLFRYDVLNTRPIGLLRIFFRQFLRISHWISLPQMMLTRL